jgi:hypothetical protein
VYAPHDRVTRKPMACRAREPQSALKAAPSRPEPYAPSHARSLCNAARRAVHGAPPWAATLGPPPSPMTAPGAPPMTPKTAMSALETFPCCLTAMAIVEPRRRSSAGQTTGQGPVSTRSSPSWTPGGPFSLLPEPRQPHFGLHRCGPNLTGVGAPPPLVGRPPL